jgi:hypothetical protein
VCSTRCQCECPGRRGLIVGGEHHVANETGCWRKRGEHQCVHRKESARISSWDQGGAELYGRERCALDSSGRDLACRASSLHLLGAHAGSEASANRSSEARGLRVRPKVERTNLLYLPFLCASASLLSDPASSRSCITTAAQLLVTHEPCLLAV